MEVRRCQLSKLGFEVHMLIGKDYSGNNYYKIVLISLLNFGTKSHLLEQIRLILLSKVQRIY